MAKFSVINCTIGTVKEGSQRAGEKYAVLDLKNLKSLLGNRSPKQVIFNDIIVKVYEDALAANNNNWQEVIKNKVLDKDFVEFEGSLETFHSPIPFYRRRIVDGIIQDDFVTNPDGSYREYNDMVVFVPYEFEARTNTWSPVDGEDVNIRGEALFNRTCVPAARENTFDANTPIPDVPELPAENGPAAINAPQQPVQPAQQPVQQQAAPNQQQQQYNQAAR